jgi:NAD(P)-dependent dehydrogenase (short-subunit alcohol dehydrogenase family)
MWDELDRTQSEAHGIPRGEWYKKRVKRIPLKRAGMVEDVAAMCLFLCSEAGDYITGQTYNLDGGSELN